jgi:RimJ/RimL family protein N-acetyltransferase
LGAAEERLLGHEQDDRSRRAGGGHHLELGQRWDARNHLLARREHWGKGAATAAVARFVELEPVRPLYGVAAKDNAASIRVLQKCGFVPVGESKGYANARGEEIDEIILALQT